MDCRHSVSERATSAYTAHLHHTATTLELEKGKILETIVCTLVVGPIMGRPNMSKPKIDKSLRIETTLSCKTTLL